MSSIAWYNGAKGKMVSNIFDLIKFPDKDERSRLYQTYDVFKDLKTINTSFTEKYKEIPAEFKQLIFGMLPWINEFNYAIFVLKIPLLFMLHIHTKCMQEIDLEEKTQYKFLFNYFAEQAAYYIKCAFEKSVYIFDALFDLNINQGRDSYIKTLQKIESEAENDEMIKTVQEEIKKIEKNPYYMIISDVRNKNTHGLNTLHRKHFAVYDKDKGVVYFYDQEPLEGIQETIFGAVELLGSYSDFIMKTIE